MGRLRGYFTLRIDSELWKCPIFVGSFQNLSDSWQKNKCTGLISWMCNLLLESWMDSNILRTRCNTLNYEQRNGYFWRLWRQESRTKQRLRQIINVICNLGVTLQIHLISMSYCFTVASYSIAYEVGLPPLVPETVTWVAGPLR